MTGYSRNIEAKIQYLLANFPAVVILGARQIGKTTLSKMICPNWRYVDLENPNDYEMLANEPVFFFKRNDKHVIIDEAQEFPDIFKVLRGVIDANRSENGRFLLTGSSSPELLYHVSESLAGRVAVIELGTLKANELSHQKQSAFYELFKTKLDHNKLPSGQAPLTQEQLHRAWLKGGYPQPLLAESDDIYYEWMSAYQDTYINRDIAKLFPQLNKIAYQRFIMMLGKLSGTIINRSEVARSVEISERTIRDYIDIASGTYLWRQLPSYEKNIKKAITKMPKGHIRDSGLLHYLLKIHSLDELYADPIVGHSFESFVIEEILKGINDQKITNCDAYYYRTRNGAEIDLILEGYFGLLPIEIKYGSKINHKQLFTLKSFVKEHQLPFGLLINQSDRAEWISEDIFQLPATWL